MAHFIPHSDADRAGMLKALGLASTDALYNAIPPSLLLPPPSQDGLTEHAALETLREMAGRDTPYRVILRGAGAYWHTIPAVVDHLSAREEFVTAYTPYQAELSQGVLQSIFEYQSMICALTGMDAANASVYDGASAAGEAAFMCAERSRRTVVTCDTLSPHTLAVLRTYCQSHDMPLTVLPHENGRWPASLGEAVNDQTACVLVQSPNYYGLLEGWDTLANAAHAAGAKLVAHVNPISLGMLQPPPADVVCGEGQPLGLPLSSGGPYLGFLACKKPLLRRLPGRIVGQTVDTHGQRAFCLTLQAREQHIKRERATSSICSNQALCALRAGIYLAAMGPQGLGEVARACYDGAHALADALTQSGCRLKYMGAYFHEFVTVNPGKTPSILSALAQAGILGGMPLNDDEILWCVTERVTAADVARVVEIVQTIV